MAIHAVEEFEVFQRAKRLYPELVVCTRTFPNEGRFLRDQICRAGNGIHACMAEGFGRSSGEWKLYLTRALGSCNEVKSHIEDAMNLGYLPKARAQHFVAEYSIVGKQLYRLRERSK